MRARVKLAKLNSIISQRRMLNIHKYAENSEVYRNKTLKPRKFSCPHTLILKHGYAFVLSALCENIFLLLFEFMHNIYVDFLCEKIKKKILLYYEWVWV